MNSDNEHDLLKEDIAAEQYRQLRLDNNIAFELRMRRLMEQSEEHQKAMQSAELKRQKDIREFNNSQIERKWNERQIFWYPLFVGATLFSAGAAVVAIAMAIAGLNSIR